MARHTVTVEELETCLNAEAWHSIASSYGNGSAKSMEVDNGGVLRVRDHGETKFLGTDKAKAVAAYNDAP